MQNTGSGTVLSFTFDELTVSAPECPIEWRKSSSSSSSNVALSGLAEDAMQISGTTQYQFIVADNTLPQVLAFYLRVYAEGGGMFVSPQYTLNISCAATSTTLTAPSINSNTPGLG